MSRIPAAVVWWALVAVAACGPPPEPYRVVLLGDSITAGIVSEPLGPSFADLLAERIPGVELVNIALSGSDSTHWAPEAKCPPGVCKRTDELLEERARPVLPADLVVVLIGSNDVSSRLTRKTSVSSYSQNLSQLSLALLKMGADHVLLVAPPPRSDSQGTSDLLLGYGRAVALVCGAVPRVECGPDLYALLDPAKDYAPREVHPNRFGHEKIAQALESSIAELRGSGSP